MSEWHRDNPELKLIPSPEAVDPASPARERWRRQIQRTEGDAAREVCSACFGSGVERFDRGLGERCSLCKGRGV